jgi:hypothetical protein
VTDGVDRVKLRRLRILQALATAFPEPLGQRALLASLQSDSELDPSLEKLRDDAVYLESYDLVRILADQDSDWIALDLTATGRTWLTVPGEHGIAIYSPDEVPLAAPGHLDRRSRVIHLPPELRAWLDQELLRNGFSDYRGLASAIAEKGWQISKSAVHRYGVKLKGVIAERQARAAERAELARALAGIYGTDTQSMLEGALGVGLTRVLDAIDQGDYNAEADTLSALVKAIPSLAKGFSEVDRQRTERQARDAALREAAERVDSAAQERGLSVDDVKFWRDQVLMGM